MPAEAPSIPPPVISIIEAPAFVTVTVGRGNVQESAYLTAQYVPMLNEHLRFSQPDIPILGIFAVAGDVVQVGDIIAALDIPEIQQELDEFNRRRNRLVLNLTQLEERHNLSLYLAEVLGEPIDDLSFIEGRASILSEMAFVDMHIAYLHRRDDARYLRTPISGIVSRVVTFEEGMRSRVAQVIATVEDSSYTAFVVRSAEAALMLPGDRFNMDIGQEIFLMEVVDPEYLGIIRSDTNEREAFLVFMDAPPTIETVVRGRVHMIFDEETDVLYIPAQTLRRVGDRTFVYVLENGLRAVRDVTVGLEGNTTVAILSGLSEGELIIR